MRYIYCSWVQSLRHFLRKTNAELRYPEIWTPTPQLQNDEFLMNIFRRDKGLHLGRINSVRLHLQIVYISYIATADWYHLLDTEINQKGETGRKSELKWPVQPPLGREAWRAWEKALNKISKQKKKISESLGQ